MIAEQNDRKGIDLLVKNARGGHYYVVVLFNCNTG